jgi:NAD(P)-dependent dehydrogenase (short-subunit alcohol dehydrogenase family)
MTAGCSGSGPEIIQDLPTGSFDGEPTAEEVTEGLSLTGKVAVVTGCNSGLGLETMRVLALRGAHVFGTGRNMERASAACSSVEGRATPVVLELSDLQSCVDCAAAIRAQTPVVDMLICNAGIVGGSDLQVVNGIEQTLAVNHFGHFVLVNHLLGHVRAAAQGRVVMVSSAAAYGSLPEGGIDFDNLDGSRGYSTFEFYSMSKLANALFALELSERFEGSRASANSIHPGNVRTNIGRNMGGFMRIALSAAQAVTGREVPEGAATQCYVATSPALREVSGYYFEDCNPVDVPGSWLYDRELAQRLWDVTESLTAGYLRT